MMCAHCMIDPVKCCVHLLPMSADSLVSRMFSESVCGVLVLYTLISYHHLLSELSLLATRLIIWMHDSA